MVKSGGEEQAYAVCALREGGTESVAVDLALEEYAEFSVVGNCPIHLTGYFMPLDEDEDDGLMPDYGEEDSDFDMDMDDDPALLGYDASGLPIYDGEGDSEDDDGDDDDDLSDESDESDDDDVPQGNVIEIKDVTDGVSDEEGSDKDDSDEDDGDDSDDSDDSEESEESDEEPAPAPEPAQKKRKAEPQQKAQQQKPAAAKKEEPVTQTKTKSQKFANGFEIHELKQGKASGKVAKAGKRVTMKYVGKLTNGKIFDQTKGKATFKFRLGVGEVIKGWDRGVEGMRVGDRRKLVCPPSMAYGSSRTGPIPPNSTLIFEVELVDVR